LQLLALAFLCGLSGVVHFSDIFLKFPRNPNKNLKGKQAFTGIMNMSAQQDHPEGNRKLQNHNDSASSCFLAASSSAFVSALSFWVSILMFLFN